MPDFEAMVHQITQRIERLARGAHTHDAMTGRFPRGVDHDHAGHDLQVCVDQLEQARLVERTQPQRYLRIRFSALRVLLPVGSVHKVLRVGVTGNLPPIPLFRDTEEVVPVSVGDDHMRHRFRPDADGSQPRLEADG
jgi:hypothetical protein